MSECVHHWILEEPNGTRFVDATCKKCGAARVMKASDDVPDGDWRTIRDRSYPDYTPRVPQPHQERKPAGQPRKNAAKHGTYSYYANYHCPCAPCKAAGAAYAKAYRERRKAS